MPLQDYPNHLARAVVMADLMFHHGQHFGAVFEYHFLIVPYVLGDWLLATLIQLLGTAGAARLWTVLVFLSLPGALWTYLRAKQTPVGTTVALLVLSLYLSTDTFFVLGFLSFRLAVAAVLLTLAVAEPLSRRWSVARYAALAAIVVLAYLTHFAALVFVAVAMGTCGLIRLVQRASSIGREIRLLMPVGCVLAWHFLVANRYRQPADQVAEAFVWGTPSSKAAGLLWDFLGYDSRWQLLIVAVLAVCLLSAAIAPARALLSRHLHSSPDVLEHWVIALAFLGMYVCLPSSYSEASFVDVRAVALFWLFFIIGLLRLNESCKADSSFAERLAFALAIALVTLNLGYLAKQLQEDGRWLVQYRAIVAQVPGHSSVLPVYTAVRRGVIRSSLHAGSYVVTDRVATIPYLFSADRGDPMKYFRYVDRPYAPDEDWYGARRQVDWKRVGDRYQFLLLMKPFDSSRIPIRGHIVAENRVALLLAIQ